MDGPLTGPLALKNASEALTVQPMRPKEGTSRVKSCEPVQKPPVEGPLRATVPDVTEKLDESKTVQDTLTARIPAGSLTSAWKVTVHPPPFKTEGTELRLAMLGPTLSGVAEGVGVLDGVSVGVNVGGGVTLGVKVAGEVGLGILVFVAVGAVTEVGVFVGVMLGTAVGTAVGGLEVAVGAGGCPPPPALGGLVGGTEVAEGAGAGVLVGVRAWKGEVNWGWHTGPGGMFSQRTPGMRSVWPGVRLMVPLA